MTEIINAEITGTQLGFEDRGIFTFSVDLNYGGNGAQSFGGYALGKEYTNYVIKGILKTVGVDNWEDLKGKHVRVERERLGKVLKIGNLLEDNWFNPVQ